jgi:hypothetical protein
MALSQSTGVATMAHKKPYVSKRTRAWRAMNAAWQQVLKAEAYPKFKPELAEALCQHAYAEWRKTVREWRTVA